MRACASGCSRLPELHLVELAYSWSSLPLFLLEPGPGVVARHALLARLARQPVRERHRRLVHRQDPRAERRRLVEREPLAQPRGDLVRLALRLGQGDAMPKAADQLQVRALARRRGVRHTEGRPRV